MGSLRRISSQKLTELVDDLEATFDDLENRATLKHLPFVEMRQQSPKLLGGRRAGDLDLAHHIVELAILEGADQRVGKVLQLLIGGIGSAERPQILLHAIASARIEPRDPSSEVRVLVDVVDHRLTARVRSLKQGVTRNPVSPAEERLGSRTVPVDLLSIGRDQITVVVVAVVEIVRFDNASEVLGAVLARSRRLDPEEPARGLCRLTANKYRPSLELPGAQRRLSESVPIRDGVSVVKDYVFLPRWRLADGEQKIGLSDRRAVYANRHLASHAATESSPERLPQAVGAHCTLLLEVTQCDAGARVELGLRWTALSQAPLKWHIVNHSRLKLELANIEAQGSGQVGRPRLKLHYIRDPEACELSNALSAHDGPARGLAGASGATIAPNDKIVL